jgi:hypothetical protein
MPTTLAEMMRVADSYALGDPMQPAIAGDPTPRNQPRQDQYRNNHHNKRREHFPDMRYGVQHVAAVQDNSGAGNSQRQKNRKPAVGWIEKIVGGEKTLA